MRVIALGVVLMLAGLVLLFGMVARVIESGFVLSLLAYTMALAGLLLGVFGIVRRMGPRP